MLSGVSPPGRRRIVGERGREGKGEEDDEGEREKKEEGREGEMKNEKARGEMTR